MRFLRFSAPEGRVVLQRVSLEPIERFLATGAELPILGDDPRHPNEPKAFSAAPIEGRVRPRGLSLYRTSERALRLGRGGGLERRATSTEPRRRRGHPALWHRLGTRDLLPADPQTSAALGDQVEAFCESDFRTRPDGLIALANPRGDEINRLAASFHAMGERIVEQVQALRDTDEHRRQLIANVSHDLRTPLAALEGYLETLLMKDAEVSQSERRHYLEVARKSGARLSRLVDELFELAKLEACSTPPNVEAFSIAELVHDVLQKFQLHAQSRRIELVIDIEHGASFANAEIGLIERVLENLVDNAIRHTPPGGKVELRVVPAQPGNVEVMVVDSGPGIPARDLPHIFDRFYRAADSRRQEPGGAGLGLAIAKRIIELHNSTLRAKSQIGVGNLLRVRSSPPPRRM